MHVACKYLSKLIELTAKSEFCKKCFFAKCVFLSAQCARPQVLQEVEDETGGNNPNGEKQKRGEKQGDANVERHHAAA